MHLFWQVRRVTRSSANVEFTGLEVPSWNKGSDLVTEQEAFELVGYSQNEFAFQIMHGKRSFFDFLVIRPSYRKIQIFWAYLAKNCNSSKSAYQKGLQNLLKETSTSKTLEWDDEFK